MNPKVSKQLVEAAVEMSMELHTDTVGSSSMCTEFGGRVVIVIVASGQNTRVAARNAQIAAMDCADEGRSP